MDSWSQEVGEKAEGMSAVPVADRAVDVLFRMFLFSLFSSREKLSSRTADQY